MANWGDADARCVAIYLDGRNSPDRAEDGTPLLDDDFLVLVNSWWEPLDFVVPGASGQRWCAEIDTYRAATRRRIPRSYAQARAEGLGPLAGGPARELVVLFTGRR